MLSLSDAQELLARYCFAHDSQNLELLEQCLSSSVSLLGKTGRREVVQAYADSYRQLTRRRRHVLTNFMFLERSESHARVQAYETFYLVDDQTESIELHLTGIYRVRLVRENDQWFIQTIEGSFDVPYNPGDAPPLPRIPLVD